MPAPREQTYTRRLIYVSVQRTLNIFLQLLVIYGNLEITYPGVFYTEYLLMVEIPLNIKRTPITIFVRLKIIVFHWGQCVLTTAQKMIFSTKGFFSKCDQIRSFLRISSHLLKQSLMENFIFCAVYPFGKSKSKTMVESLRFYKIFLRMWLCSKWSAIQKLLTFCKKALMSTKKNKGHILQYVKYQYFP